MNVVLDTNIWVSGLLCPKSIPGRIITAWQHALFHVTVSQPILSEIERVLAYPKIRKRLSVSPEDIDEYLIFIRFFAKMIDLKNEADFSLHPLRDKNDIPILATLIESKADYLITGDQDLLVLSEQYPIITANAFVEFLD